MYWFIITFVNYVCKLKMFNHERKFNLQFVHLFNNIFVCRVNIDARSMLCCESEGKACRSAHIPYMAVF